MINKDAVNLSVLGKATAAPADSPPNAGPTDSPDWDQVPFVVECARCGKDLRGRTEPVCPACALPVS